MSWSQCLSQGRLAGLGPMRRVSTQANFRTSSMFEMSVTARPRCLAFLVILVLVCPNHLKL